MNQVFTFHLHSINKYACIWKCELCPFQCSNIKGILTRSKEEGSSKNFFALFMNQNYTVLLIVWTIISFILLCHSEHNKKRRKKGEGRGRRRRKKRWFDFEGNAFTFEFGMLVRHYVQMFRRWYGDRTQEIRLWDSAHHLVGCAVWRQV